MPHDSKHERTRVAGTLRGPILDYLTQHVGVGGEFYMRDLAVHCVQQTGCALSSPDRIFRMMGPEDDSEPTRLAYVVINRRRSHYRLTGLWPDGRPAEGPEQLDLLAGVA